MHCRGRSPVPPASGVREVVQGDAYIGYAVRAMDTPLKFLAVSGSLRIASVNSALLRVACTLAPKGIAMTLHQGLHELPLFNPDLEPELIPAVVRWRAAVCACDALVIASPEYAHGISGPMKNALDWLVSGEEFVHKPLALWNAAPRATHAYAALREVVTVMSGRLVEEAFVTVPAGSWMSDAEIAARTEITGPLAGAMAALARACRADQALSASSSS